jgi:8-oxo-dGTP diphosphatase
MAKRAESAKEGETQARQMVLVAAVALVDAKEKILLTKRPEGKSMPGLWEFPGGKVEEGETAEIALARELKEELGIDVEPGALTALTTASHAYEDFDLLMPLYLCREWRGVPRGREGQECLWVAAEDMRALAMPPADTPLIDKLEALF